MIRSLMYLIGFLPLLPLFLVLLDKEDLDTHINKSCKSYMLLLFIFILMYFTVTILHFNKKVIILIGLISILIMKIFIITG